MLISRLTDIEPTETTDNQEKTGEKLRHLHVSGIKSYGIRWNEWNCTKCKGSLNHLQKVSNRHRDAIIRSSNRSKFKMILCVQILFQVMTTGERNSDIITIFKKSP